MGVALIAVDAVPHEVLVSRMPLRCSRLRMADGALENRVITRIGMAGGAHPLRVAVSHGEPGVVKRGSQPIRGNPGCMASHTGGREPGRSMVGVGRCRVIGLVARVAIRGRQHVIVVHMTTGAGRGRMHPLQRPVSRRVCVIECRIRPGNRIVTRIAGRGEPGVGNGADRVGEVAYMAAGLVARPTAKSCCVVRAVALRALHRRMEAGEGKARGGVIELAIRPDDGVVATIAGGGEAQRFVVHRTDGGVVVVLVARNASRVGDVVVVADVAQRAR